MEVFASQKLLGEGCQPHPEVPSHPFWSPLYSWQSIPKPPPEPNSLPKPFGSQKPLSHLQPDPA